MPQLKKVLRSVGVLEYVMPSDVKIYESPVMIGVDSNFEDLVKSVCKHGVIEPIVVVTNSNEPGKFYVIDGIRRVRAARNCNIDRIPAYVLRLDIANPEHVPIIDALAITLRATTRLHNDDVLDMKVISRVVRFIFMNVSDDVLGQLKSGSIPSITVNMLSDLAGVSTSTAHRWMSRVLSEHPETLISVLRSRGLIQDVREVQSPSPTQPETPPQPQPPPTAPPTPPTLPSPPPQSESQQATQPVVVQTSVTSGIEQKADAGQKVVIPPAKVEPEVIMCGGNAISRSLYDSALNDDDLGPFMLSLCRRGLVNNDILQRLLQEHPSRKRQFVDENISVLSNKINVPVPATTVKRIQEIATRYRTSQQDIIGKLGMLIYVFVRLIEESETNKPILAKLDEVIRYAFLDLEQLKKSVRDFVGLLTD